MHRFRVPLIHKSKLGIIGYQFFLARQHKSLPPLFSGILDGALEQLSRIAMFPVCRDRIDTKNHLPCAVFIVHFCPFVHLIRQIRLVCDEAVHKRNQLFAFKHEPEMISIILNSLRKLLFRCGFRCRKAFCFHGCNLSQICYCRCSYLHNISYNPIILVRG